MNLPVAFLSRISTQLGIETEAFLQALKAEPVTSVRFHALKANPENADFVKGEKVEWNPNGYYLPERPSFTADPWFHAGAYYVQEASSMITALFLEPERYDCVLDACAAPGGKTTLLLDTLPESTVLVANEVIKSRAGILAENLSRWGNPNVIVTNNDPQDFSRLSGLFDLILTDAPCSGEGMFRKDKDSIKEWSPENVAICSARQRRILNDLYPALSPGGYLIYSTCTYSPEENTQSVTLFLEEHPDMELYPLVLPREYGMLPVKIAGVENAAYQCFPHHCRGEGFFICRLRKKGEKTEVSEVESREKNSGGKGKNKDKKFGNFEKNTFQVTEFPWEKWINHFNPRCIKSADEYVFYLLPQVEAVLARIISLRVIKKGLLLGKIQGKDFIPSHELALSTLISPEVPGINLPCKTAIQYLMKSDLDNETGLEKGWILAKYKDVNLGWIKIAGNRLKNHFPIHWRIRNL